MNIAYKISPSKRALSGPVWAGKACLIQSVLVISQLVATMSLRRLNLNLTSSKYRELYCVHTMCPFLGLQEKGHGS